MTIKTNLPFTLMALGHTVSDGVVTVADGSVDEYPDRCYASVVVTGTVLAWGRGGVVGQDTAIDQFLDSSIWIQSGQIDGVVENSTIRVNRVTRVDPRSGDVDFNDLDRNLQIVNQICENSKTNIK
ncbi:hypothetical protein [Paramagnetospirillum marisnigri]|nr:hypothetical protein [Paramagnetospirillum marisnigri]